jgi:cell division protein FtsA
VNATDVAPAAKRRQATQRILAAALDVGVAKTVCLAAPVDPDFRRPRRSFDALGVGLQSASPTGVPRDFDDCARSIRIAVDEAERGVEAAVHEVAAAYSGPGLQSRIVIGRARIRSGAAAVRDAEDALTAALQSVGPGKVVLHVTPLGYAVDGGRSRSDPRGVRGRVLAAEACVVTAPAEAVEALRQCIRAAGVEPVEVAAGPYAAALGVTTEDERKLGVMVVDLGAGGTGLACLCDDGLALVDHVPAGAARMTRELANQLEATYASAERAKLLHGVVGGTYDSREAIAAPRLGRDGRLEPQVVARQAFADVLAPRFREILLMAWARLKKAGLPAHRTPQRVVLVGGGARICGAREAAQELLGLPVRIGHPIGVADLGSARAGPAFATAAGLMRWRFDRPPEACISQTSEPSLKEVGAGARSAVFRAWTWLKENF